MQRPARTAFAPRRAPWRSGALAALAAVLAACEQPGGATTPAAPAETTAPAPAAPAPAPLPADTDPEAFDLTETTYWDGRPSLGGVWAAHPLAEKPVRVRIINVETGDSADGALFRRDPALTGAPVLLSYDAARAIGVKAGVDTQIRIVALKTPDDLRREAGEKAEAEATAAAEADAAEAVETAAEAAPAEAPPVATTAAGTPPPAPQETAAQPAEPAPATTTAESAPAAPPVETAAGEEAEEDYATSVARALAEDAPVAAKQPAAEAQPAAVEAPSAAEQPAAAEVAAAAPEPAGEEEPPVYRYIQAGSFRIESNAEDAAERFRGRGMTARVDTQASSGGKTWSRVLLGPFGTREAMREAMATVKASGFGDAIYVDD